MIKRLTLTVLLLIGAGTAAYITFNKPAAYCMLAKVIYMHEAGDNIYISPDATEDQSVLCLNLVKEAKERNALLWGEVKSEPVFIFCTNWGDYYKFGMYRTQAMTRMNFAGEFIILSPNGLNADDISHEMCHAELYHRAGYENDKEIPLWFHEGLAMMLCKEYPQNYSDYQAAWQKMTNGGPDIIPLDRISSDEDFYSSPTRSNLAYWRSGMEVTRWFEKSGKKGLLELLDDLSNGEDFQPSYERIERGEY